MNRKNGPLKPWEIRRCTLPELAILLDDNLEKRRPMGGMGAELSYEDICLRTEWRREAMTVEQRAAALCGELSVQKQVELAWEWKACQNSQKTTSLSP